MGKILSNREVSGNGFFDIDVGNEGDVWYAFSSREVEEMSIDRSKYMNKVVNMSEVYRSMVKEVAKYMNSDEYYERVRIVGMRESVNEYTRERYEGMSIEYVDSIVNNKGSNRAMNSESLYDILIEGSGGIEKVDWVRVYDNVDTFKIGRQDVWLRLAEEILGGSIFEYYRSMYNIRNVRIVGDYLIDRRERFVFFDYDGGEYRRGLDNLVRNREQWWRKMCGDMSKNREHIKDYRKLLGGRREDEVLPEYCPVFRNLRLNYTQIDFDKGKKNIKRCSEVAGYSERGETWSFASIDRIDSSKGYSYDNIRIISQYANQLKNCGSIDQMRMLLKYMDEQNSYF